MVPRYHKVPRDCNLVEARTRSPRSSIYDFDIRDANYLYITETLLHELYCGGDIARDCRAIDYVTTICSVHCICAYAMRIKVPIAPLAPGAAAQLINR